MRSMRFAPAGKRSNIGPARVAAWGPVAIGESPEGALAGMTADPHDFEQELGHLEALRTRLLAQLELNDVWRALRQLDERERAGHPLQVVESAALRRALEAQLRARAPVWALLAPLDALMAALRDPDPHAVASITEEPVSRLSVSMSQSLPAPPDVAEVAPIRVKIKAGSLTLPKLEMPAGPWLADVVAAVPSAPASVAASSPGIETVSAEALARIRGIKSFVVDPTPEPLEHAVRRGPGHATQRPPQEPAPRTVEPVAMASTVTVGDERAVVDPSPLPPQSVASQSVATVSAKTPVERIGEDRLAALEAEVDLLITAPAHSQRQHRASETGAGQDDPADMAAVGNEIHEADPSEIDVDEAEVTIIPLEKPAAPLRAPVVAVTAGEAVPLAEQLRQKRSSAAAPFDDDTVDLDDIDEAAVEIIHYDRPDPAAERRGAGPGGDRDRPEPGRRRKTFSGS